MTEKRIMIFGAGQAGQMAARWLPAGGRLAAFIDNDKTKQGHYLCDVPVISYDEAFGTPEAAPDVVYLAVINREACAGIRDMIQKSGFAGQIIEINRLKTAMDIRFAAMRLAASEIKSGNVPGSVAELGVYQGEFAARINGEFPDRELFLFDTFEGFSEDDLAIEKEKAGEGKNARAKAGDFGDTSLERVKAVLPCPDKAIFCVGRFPDSMEKYPELCLEDKKFAFVSLDTDLYEPTYEGLKFFYPRLSPGGYVFIHDYNSSQYPGVKRGVDEFRKEVDIKVMPLPDLHGTGAVLK